MTVHTTDIAVIGAGIAGASVASELAKDASVLLIEKEEFPGYHSTGRSAAMYIPSYGPPLIQALTKASGAFFQHCPNGFCDTALLRPRAEMLVARQDQLSAIEKILSENSHSDSMQPIDAEEVLRRCPLLKPNYAAAGVLETSGSDIDVHALHQGFLSLFKQRSGTLITNSEVHRLKKVSNGWTIQTSTDEISTGIVVNAAGAWADELGKIADAETIGLVPKRRTALMIELPGVSKLDSIPLVADIEEAFYIKPDAGRLLISPANEDPSPPCDVQPEELDIAICINEVEKAFTFKVNTIIRKWAGLRSFVRDNSPVAGYSSQADNFFWLAGQGGYGIQSSPALARYAAALILDQQLPDDLIRHGLTAESLSVNRLVN